VTNIDQTLLDLGAALDADRLELAVDSVELLKVARRFGLQTPVSQYLVTLRDDLAVHVDFAYPEQMLAIEVDSVRWHSGRRAIKWDNERQNLLVALGWRVLRFEWNDILGRSAVVAVQIVAALWKRQTAFDLCQL
jgi:very-short-patch-repair endonuclease